MIQYRRNLLKLFQMEGSVFPKAVGVAGPCAVICVIVVIFQGDGDIFGFVGEEKAITRDNAVWSGFSFLVGFLIVFRTSQSYSRFWDGVTAMHRMRAEWFDGCSSLLAFCKNSTASEEAIKRFQNTLVRLFSMLHSAALGEIEDSCGPTIVDDVRSFHFELLDAGGIDSESLKAIKHSEAKVELVFQWIQQLMVENIGSGVLNIAPPILSRAFQEIASGMVAFHDAMKISQVPFPFPYAQTCDFLLCLHWLVVPFIVSQWCKEPVWAFVFSFIQVFVLWTLNFIAVELENPFGSDKNDIDGEEMQEEMNMLLLLLLSPACTRVPRLTEEAADLTRRDFNRTTGLPSRDIDHRTSFCAAWSMIDETEGLTRPLTHRKCLTKRLDCTSSRNMSSPPRESRTSTTSSHESHASTDKDSGPHIGSAASESIHCNTAEPNLLGVVCPQFSSLSSRESSDISISMKRPPKSHEPQSDMPPDTRVKADQGAPTSLNTEKSKNSSEVCITVNTGSKLRL